MRVTSGPLLRFHLKLYFIFFLSDYYILENNSLLKAALKTKRIQLTDFRTVPTEHFGAVSVPLSPPPPSCDSAECLHVLSLSSQSYP